jgi:hypothetical protein
MLEIPPYPLDDIAFLTFRLIVLLAVAGLFITVLKG